MARYYGTVLGHRGEASRLGTPRSGMIATAAGWQVGARVDLDAHGPADACHLRPTGGSDGHIGLRIGLSIYGREAGNVPRLMRALLPGRAELFYLETAEGWEEISGEAWVSAWDEMRGGAG